MTFFLMVMTTVSRFYVVRIMEEFPGMNIGLHLPQLLKYAITDFTDVLDAISKALAENSGLSRIETQ
uniref:Uncharacterized protein n=1 Tax=Tanacetum cinerariifolium TaxID=118510 RepID=A0A699J1C6_TANCI|nr:hypothetical protein [Tanacetum cinerariifolium]